jgi:hypothetical protein
MALPSSGPISLGAMATEFGDAQPNSLSEYYRNGALVKDYMQGPGITIPTSGAVSLGQFYGAVGVTPTGYATLGGTIDGLRFVDEINYRRSATLPTQSTEWGGGNSSTSGYVAGESASNATQYVSALRFSPETTLSISATASAGRTCAAANSTTHIYWAGGWQGAINSIVNIIDGLVFSNESRVTAGAMAAAKHRHGAFNSSTTAYWPGGLNSTGNISYHDTMVFSTLSKSFIAGLTPRRNLCAFNSTTSGYTSPGNTDPGSGTVIPNITSYLRFATNSQGNTGFVLSVARNWSGAYNSTEKGYICGGRDTSSNARDEIDAMSFTTETSTGLTTRLASTRGTGVAGFQSGGIL